MPFVLLACALGCSSMATVTTKTGREIDVHFAGSDRENVYVETPEGPRPIPRSEITDIDHPGDGAAVVGGLLATYGVVNIAVGADKCDTEGAAFCMGVFLPATLGVSMLLWGASVHWSSASALDQSPGRGAARQPQLGAWLGDDGKSGGGVARVEL